MYAHWKRFLIGALMACTGLVAGCGSDSGSQAVTLTEKVAISDADVNAYALNLDGTYDATKPVSSKVVAKAAAAGTVTLSVSRASGPIIIVVTAGATSKAIDWSTGTAVVTAVVVPPGQYKKIISDVSDSAAVAASLPASPVTDAMATEIITLAGQNKPATATDFSKIVVAGTNVLSSAQITVLVTSFVNGTLSTTQIKDQVTAQTTNIAKILTDTVKPTAPAGLASISATGSAVVLTWTASTDPKNSDNSDGSGIAGYDIYRDGTKVGTSSTTTFTDTTVAVSKSYKYTVKAFDKANNVSDASNELAVTTPATTGPGLSVTVGGVVN